MKSPRSIPLHFRAALVALALAPLCAQERTHLVSAESGTTQQDAQRYAALSSQVVRTRGAGETGRAYHTSAADEINEQLRRIIQGEVIDHLDVVPNTEMAVKNAIAEVQGASSLDADRTSAPLVELYELAGTRKAAVAYVLDQGGDFLPDILPYLEFYDRLGGEWHLRATAPTVETFHGGTFYVQRMNGGITSESWWLVWGVTFGDTGSRVKARLYAFDGGSVKTIWKRDDLHGGELSATSETVTLDYDSEHKPSRPVTRIHEVYRATPNGLIQVQ